MRGWLPAALLGLAALRLAVAGATGLAPDEAYYWVWSKALAPGYPDHPPMVAFWIRLGTALGGEGAFGVRLLGPLVGLLGSYLLARAAEDLFPGRGAGPRAALLFNATLFLGVGGVIISPDTPLLFFWAATLWALGRLLKTGQGWWFLVAGLAAGGGLLSKYTAVLLAPAIGLWLLLTPCGRGWLRRPWPWAALALALLCFLPNLLWEAGHGWASFLRQGGRTEAWNPARAGQFLLELLGGQIGLATPLVFWLGLRGTLALLPRWREPGALLLLVMVLLPAAVFAEHALGDRVQGNWPAILWPAACLAAAALPGRSWRPAVALGLVLGLAVYLQAVLAPFRLPITRDPTLLRLAGWEEFFEDVAMVQRRGGYAFVAADQYGIAAELAHGLRVEVPVLGVEDRWRLFALPPAAPEGRPGLLVTTMRQASPPDARPWQSLTLLGTLTRSRNGMMAEGFRLWSALPRPAGPGGPVLTRLPRPD